MKYFFWSLGREQLPHNSRKGAWERFIATINEAMRGGLTEEEATFKGWWILLKPLSFLAGLLELIPAFVQEALFTWNKLLETFESTVTSLILGNIDNSYIASFLKTTFSIIYFFSIKLYFLIAQIALDVTIALCIEPFTRMPRNLKHIGLNTHQDAMDKSDRGILHKALLGISFFISGLAAYFVNNAGGFSFLANLFADSALFVTYVAAWKIILLVTAVLYIPSLIGQLFSEYREYKKNSMPEESQETAKTEMQQEYMKMYQSEEHDNENFKWPREKVINTADYRIILDNPRCAIYVDESQKVVVKSVCISAKQHFNIEIFALITIKNHPAIEQYPYVISIISVDFKNRAFEMPAANKNLRDAIQEDGVTFEVQKKWMEQIAQGLSVIHGAEIMHGDIKPSNVLVFRDKNIKICDFDSAKTINEMDKKMPSTLLGTPLFMAPELLSYSNRSVYPYSYKCDIYALGLVCVEIVMKCDPYNDINKNTTNGFEILRILYQLLVVTNLGVPLTSIDNPHSPFKDTKEGCSMKTITPAFSELVHSCCNYAPLKRPTSEEFIKKVRTIKSFS